MPKIQVMNEHLSNKIAAGEVVERPASVVKELVENAIDAGSSQIELFISEGGLDYIKIVDNGAGMDRTDSVRAFERHATSKLLSDQDLFRITTLGFRGEALPSIAAVSKVTLQTWNGEEETGTKVVIEGGKTITVEDAPLRQGAILEVKELFYNTPARYKYLKTIHTELSHISDYINRMALAHPNIAFTLFHNDRELLRTNGSGQILHVVSAIYGMSTAKQMIPFSASHIDFEVSGFLGKPEITRSSKQYMTIIINGRYIKNYAIQQSIASGYQTLLPIHRYPLVVLSFKLDPSLLDINVHPSKLEIRISKEQELTSWLEEEISKTLRKSSLIPKPLQKAEKEKQIQQSIHFQLPQTDLITSSSLGTVPYSPQEDKERRMPDRVREVAVKSETTEKPVDFEASEKKVDIEATREGSEVKQIPLLFPLAQLHGTYILAQNEEGLYMIDQHAAQERIWYEFYHEKLSKPIQENQELLFPITLDFTAGEFNLLKENLDQLAELGLFLEQFGHHSYMIRSHPQWFPAGEEEQLIRDMIQRVLEQKGKIKWIEFRNEVAIMMSCKQSIKANQYLSQREMEALLEQLRNSSNPYTCPHGRPITVLITKYDIEKMFKRVM